jgi:DNA mismatch repair protein MutS2
MSGGSRSSDNRWSINNDPGLGTLRIIMDDTFFEQAAVALEWDKLSEVLAGQARSTMGAALCRSLPLAEDLEAAVARLQETDEMLGLSEGEDLLPATSFPDIRDLLGRAVKGAVLDAVDLRACSTAIGVGRALVRYVERRQGQAPALWAAAQPMAGLAALRPLHEAIDRAVDEEGHIRETATEELRRLSHHAQGLKQQIRRRLDAILASARYAEVLQEQYVAIREGRYVVPVKAEMRTKIPGIVHDVSASGATVFFEPRELVELNNAVKLAELEVEREVTRIRKELSAEVAAHAEQIGVGLEAMALLDCIAAKAALSRLLHGRPIAVNRTGAVVLRQARHPLLVLARTGVVPNDVVLSEQDRVLVISGPNTGGKTVTLKLVGLIALMVRAGLQPPCGEGSTMPLFTTVYADIGDAQDLAKDLSSFSAHVTRMIRLLAFAAGRRAGREPQADGGTLVLLDEPATSTDPAEGAALAEALLVKLADMGLKVVATTHYNQLKTLASTRPAFRNASVEFDVSRLAPTYRLLMDLPGGSSAIEIAGRLGMDESVLEHAWTLLRKEDRDLERMLGELHETQRRLAEDLAQAAALKAEAARAAKDAAEIEERVRASEREERKRVKTKLTEELFSARAQIQQILDEAKRERDAGKAKGAKRRLAEVEEDAAAKLAASLPRVSVETLRAGDAVELARFGTIGTLLEDPAGKKQVRVRIEDRDVVVALSGLAGLPAAAGREAPAQPRASSAERRLPRGSSPAETSVALDVRGKTAEEAMEMTVAELDRAALAGIVFLRIIHGHGTGKLKQILREYLKTSPYVAQFRPGAQGEGGDGVTIVQLVT